MNTNYSKNCNNFHSFYNGDHQDVLGVARLFHNPPLEPLTLKYPWYAKYLDARTVYCRGCNPVNKGYSETGWNTFINRIKRIIPSICEYLNVSDEDFDEVRISLSQYQDILSSHSFDLLCQAELLYRMCFNTDIEFGIIHALYCECLKEHLENTVQRINPHQCIKPFSGYYSKWYIIHIIINYKIHPLNNYIDYFLQISEYSKREYYAKFVTKEDVEIIRKLYFE